MCLHTFLEALPVVTRRHENTNVIEDPIDLKEFCGILVCVCVSVCVCVCVYILLCQEDNKRATTTTYSYPFQTTLGALRLKYALVPVLNS